MHHVYHSFVSLNFEKVLIYYGVLGAFLLSFIVGIARFLASSQYGTLLVEPLWVLNFLYIGFVALLLVVCRHRVSVLSQKSVVFVIVGYVAVGVLTLIQPPFSQAGEMSGMVISHLVSLLF